MDSENMIKKAFVLKHSVHETKRRVKMRDDAEVIFSSVRLTPNWN